MLWDQDSGKHSCPLTCCGSPASTCTLFTHKFLQTVTETQLVFCCFFLPRCRSASIAGKSSVPLLCPQFAAWVDAVVFVFSLEDEISFQTVYNYFVRLSGYRNTAEVPMVLVGTQGAHVKCDPCVYCYYCLFIFKDLLTQFWNKIWNLIHTFYLQLNGTQMSKYTICSFLKKMISTWFNHGFLCLNVPFFTFIHRAICSRLVQLTLQQKNGAI